MATQPKIISCGYSVAAASMGVRFFFGPAIMAAASAAVGIRGTLLRIAIVQVSRWSLKLPCILGWIYTVSQIKTLITDALNVC